MEHIDWVSFLGSRWVITHDIEIVTAEGIHRRGRPSEFAWEGESGYIVLDPAAERLEDHAEWLRSDPFTIRVDEDHPQMYDGHTVTFTLADGSKGTIHPQRDHLDYSRLRRKSNG